MQPINYGAKVQFATPADTSTPLTDAEKFTLQQVIGCLLYYTRAANPTMLVALSTLASAQAQGISANADAMHKLLDYRATHPDAEVRFHSSDIVLQVSSDASYLSEPEARNRTGGPFYLGNNDDRQQQIKEPYFFYLASLNMSCHPRQRQKSARYSATLKKQRHCGSC
jgi:hypothetical protein